MKNASNTRSRLAKRIEEAFLRQEGLEVFCDPHAIDFPRGWYRTSRFADCYRWSAPCKFKGMENGPTVDGFDTATDCAKHGVSMFPSGIGWEATSLAKESVK